MLQSMVTVEAWTWVVIAVIVRLDVRFAFQGTGKYRRPRFRIVSTGRERHVSSAGLREVSEGLIDPRSELATQVGRRHSQFAVTG